MGQCCRRLLVRASQTRRLPYSSQARLGELQDVVDRLSHSGRDLVETLARDPGSQFERVERLSDRVLQLDQEGATLPAHAPGAGPQQAAFAS